MSGSSFVVDILFEDTGSEVCTPARKVPAAICRLFTQT